MTLSGLDNNCAVCGLSLDDHWLASCPAENADCANPVSWDGEPLYSPSTVAEGLFDGGAFEQMKGQISMEAEVEYRWGDCDECDGSGERENDWSCDACSGTGRILYGFAHNDQ